MNAALLAWPARTANTGLMDLKTVGIHGRSATFRSRQRADGRGREKILRRADLREVKRDECRAPCLAGADRQPGADGATHSCHRLILPWRGKRAEIWIFRGDSGFLAHPEVAS